MKRAFGLILTVVLAVPFVAQAQEVSVGLQSRQMQGVLNNVEREVQGIRSYVEGALNRITACGAAREFYDPDANGDGCVPLWSLNGSEAFFSNNVGIGVTNPATRLHVNGTLNISDGNAQRGLLSYGSNTLNINTASSGQIVLGVNSGSMLTVDNSQIDVSGDARINGDVHASAYYYSSDAGLKQNFAALDGLEIINKLNGFSFNWKNDGHADVGIVAQDVEKVLPELVKFDAEGNRKVDYSRLVAPLIEAVKQLSQRVEELESAQNSQ